MDYADFSECGLFLLYSKRKFHYISTLLFSWPKTLLYPCFKAKIFVWRESKLIRETGATNLFTPLCHWLCGVKHLSFQDGQTHLRDIEAIFLNTSAHQFREGQKWRDTDLLTLSLSMHTAHSRSRLFHEILLQRTSIVYCTVSVCNL